MGEGDVNSAAYAVGYQSPQQFNRDYKHLFGISPGKSIREQRQSLYEALAEKQATPGKMRQTRSTNKDCAIQPLGRTRENAT